MTSLSLGTDMPAQRAQYSDDPVSAFVVSSFYISVQRPDGSKYSHTSRYLNGRLYNVADVGGGRIAGFVGSSNVMNGLKYGFNSNGQFVDNLAIVFLREASTYFPWT